MQDSYRKKISIAALFLCCASVLNAQKTSNGINITDFRFVDTAGKFHTLQEFKGKYIYVDIWASWCYPCKKEYPILAAMIPKLDSSKVKVVSISIDHTPFRWIGALKGYNMKGYQWCEENDNFEKAFAIDRVPRFLLINPEGKIQKWNMTRPSNDSTLATLQSL